MMQKFSCGCTTRPMRSTSRSERTRNVESTTCFWGDGLSKYPIDPGAEQKIKEMYMKKFDRWESPEGSGEKPKGADITYLKVVPLSGEIKFNGFSKAIYRVYYGKKLYHECTNDSHMYNLNPEGRTCEFCHMPDDHKSCGYSYYNKYLFDKFLDKIGTKCPYSKI